MEATWGISSQRPGFSHLALGSAAPSVHASVSPSAKWDKAPLCVFGEGFPGCCSPHQLALPLGLCGMSFEGVSNYKFTRAFGMLKCTRTDGEKHQEWGKEEKG